MRSSLAAVALLLSIAILAAPTTAASDEATLVSAADQLATLGPCPLTGLACFVLEVAEAVADRVMACVQDLDCVG